MLNKWWYFYSSTSCLLTVDDAIQSFCVFDGNVHALLETDWKIHVRKQGYVFILSDFKNQH